MSYWVSPQACTTFSFDYALDGAEWVTLEKYILDYMLQEGLWPSSISRDSNGDRTNLHLYTGKDWVGRYEEDVCTIISQIAGNVGIAVSTSPC